jgi:uncharacterized protein (DUF2461 family)
MAFRGWRAEALEFFEGLEADNSKTYWQRNKGVYEQLVRAPMEELLAELAPEWGEGRIFRPYRDIRFSADKTPYKTHIGAMVGRRLRAAVRQGPRGRRGHVGDGSRPAGAVPAGGQRRPIR